MRVISGEFRGRRLASPETNAIRPTSDMVKEAMFNILQFENLDRVLDLFSGTGSLGIEASSRGANRVVFCDNNPMAIKCIRENLHFVSENAYEIFFGDYASCLRKYSNEQFNVILIDPPYESPLAEKALELISRSKTLATDGIIIVEHSANSELRVPQELRLKSKRRYGSKALSIIVWSDKIIEEGDENMEEKE